MIPIVEDYLNELLDEKLDYLMRNPEEIDKILHVSSGRRSSIKQLISKDPIKVIKGYPRLPSQLPCVCILLADEKEVQDGLGDYGDAEYYSSTDNMEELPVMDYPNSRLPYPSVTVSRKPIDSIKTVTCNVTGQRLDPSEYYVANHKMGIIGLPKMHPEDGDTVTVGYSYSDVGAEAIQVMYEANYRVEIWTQNGDLTVELYHLVKWAFLASRDWLSSTKGLTMQKLSGSDFEPVTSYFPEFAYRRALQFWCQFSVSTVTSEGEYIQAVDSTLKLTSEANIGGI